MYAAVPSSNNPIVKPKLDEGKIRGVLPHLVPVRFEFNHPTASTVYVAGTFNQWLPEIKTRRCSSTGYWWKETVLAPGTYEYCLVVDGEWMPDPLARESVLNPFGGRNSVLKVAGRAEAAYLAGVETCV